jgi:DNA-binding protein Fis
MKTCPYCAEDIQLEAIKCKHCGECIKDKSLGELKDIETAISEISQLLLSTSTPNLYHEAVSLFERILIKEAIKKHTDNQVKAAEVLGISRNTLRSKLK